MLNPPDPVRPRMHGSGPAHQAQFSFPSLFCTMEPEPVQPGMLIDVCKYLDSLQYRVWRKMVMSVESGESGCRQGRHFIQGGEPAELTFSSLPSHWTLSSLDQSLLQLHSDRAPASCSPSTHFPTAPPPLGRTPSSLGPDAWPLLQKKKLTSLSIQNRIIYIIKDLLSSGLPLSR